jgi:hypothetical protein
MTRSLRRGLVLGDRRHLEPQAAARAQLLGGEQQSVDDGLARSAYAVANVDLHLHLAGHDVDRSGQHAQHPDRCDRGPA